MPPTPRTQVVLAFLTAARAARTSQVLRTVAEGDFVVMHSRVVNGAAAGSASVMHGFRFEGDLIAELWHVGQPVPAVSPNADRMF